MTAAQERMLSICTRQAAQDGWTEWWDVANAWSQNIPVVLIASTASRTWSVLERLGLVEGHPKYHGLVRPRVQA